jgi:hypothetical protein
MHSHIRTHDMSSLIVQSSQPCLTWPFLWMTSPGERELLPGATSHSKNGSGYIRLFTPSCTYEPLTIQYHITLNSMQFEYRHRKCVFGGRGHTCVYMLLYALYLNSSGTHWCERSYRYNTDRCPTMRPCACVDNRMAIATMWHEAKNGLDSMQTCTVYNATE